MYRVEVWVAQSTSLHGSLLEFDLPPSLDAMGIKVLIPKREKHPLGDTAEMPLNFKL